MGGEREGGEKEMEKNDNNNNNDNNNKKEITPDLGLCSSVFLAYTVYRYPSINIKKFLKAIRSEKEEEEEEEFVPPLLSQEERLILYDADADPISRSITISCMNNLLLSLSPFLPFLHFLPSLPSLGIIQQERERKRKIKTKTKA